MTQAALSVLVRMTWYAIGALAQATVLVVETSRRRGSGEPRQLLAPVHVPSPRHSSLRRTSAPVTWESADRTGTAA
jgi:hypothetical protein